jgi:hypothetical protein
VPAPARLGRPLNKLTMRSAWVSRLSPPRASLSTVVQCRAVAALPLRAAPLFTSVRRRVLPSPSPRAVRHCTTVDTRGPSCDSPLSPIHHPWHSPPMTRALSNSRTRGPSSRVPLPGLHIRDAPTITHAPIVAGRPQAPLATMRSSRVCSKRRTSHPIAHRAAPSRRAGVSSARCSVGSRQRGLYTLNSRVHNAAAAER